MKIPKARKLPSGRWQCRITINGEQQSIVRDTKKAAEAEAAAIKSGAKQLVSTDLTLTQAIDRYIETKQDLFSPESVRKYRSYQRNQFQNLMHLKVKDITQQQWQAGINTMKKTYASKSIENTWRFFSSVISEATGQHYALLLPQVITKKKEWLHPDQIELFMEALEGNRHEIPILLGLHSLRMSEIRAMTWDRLDTRKEEIQVEGSLVMEEGGQYVLRDENKTKDSRRTIPFMLPQLVRAIEAADKSGDRITYAVPATLERAVARVCKQADVPTMTMHGLRKSFVSLCAHKQIPKDHVRQIGGWSSYKVVDDIYTEILKEDVKASMESYKDLFK